MRTIFERSDLSTLADDVKCYIHVAILTHTRRENKDLTMKIEYTEKAQYRARIEE